MPNIYSSTGDGWADSGEKANWILARRDFGSASDNNNTRDSSSVLVYRDSSKGGGEINVIRRAFMFFDTSGISIAPSEATLKVRGYSGNNSDILVVKSTSADPVVNGSFNDLPDTMSEIGATDGSGAGTLAGVSGLTYSSEIATWSTSGYNDIVLNSTARDDMASLDTFKICIMDYDYDYLDIAPSLSGTVYKIGFYWTDVGGTSLDPYIDYTAGVAAAVDNSVFFGCNF